MAKKVLLVVFTLECLVLSVLLAREWTLFYFNAGAAEREYARVYNDKIDAGHHAVTAEIDASTTSFVFWWGGVVCLFVGIGFGAPCWAYQQLWPELQRELVRTDIEEEFDALSDDEVFGAT